MPTPHPVSRGEEKDKDTDHLSRTAMKVFITPHPASAVPSGGQSGHSLGTGGLVAHQCLGLVPLRRASGGPWGAHV